MATKSTRPPIEVTVEIDGDELHVGSLRIYERRGQTVTFQYAESYLRDSRAYPIDPGMPLGLGVFQPPLGHDMFGTFTDISPDRWGQSLMRRGERELADREGRKARSLGPIDFMLGVRDILRQGALRLRNPESGKYLATDHDGIPALVHLPHLLAVADAYVDGETRERDIKDLLNAGGSLGGARPKAAVTLANGSLALAKFPNKKSDTWDIALWEAIEAELARNAGLDVASSELVKVANRNVLISQRFDRNGSLRIGFMSAMTMLEAKDGDARSYLEIARAIEMNSSTVAPDLEELFRRIIFSVLTNNTDDHLRNHGFLRSNHAWRLSPAYDMNPNPESTQRATALDPDGLDANIQSLYSVADLFRLSDVRAKEIVGQVQSATNEWRRIATKLGAARQEIDLMEQAFEVSQP